MIERSFSPAFSLRDLISEFRPERLERFDARPGGTYRLVLTYVDASAARGKTGADSDIVEARFVELVPGTRVRQAVDFVSDDPANAGTMSITWELSGADPEAVKRRALSR